jgi:hypothetical protein
MRPEPVDVMDEETAEAILNASMKDYRRRPYEALTELVGQNDVREVEAPDGTRYQVELTVLWNDRPGEAIRVLGSIDDGRLRAFWPLTRDFIRNPDGSFGGETP